MSHRLFVYRSGSWVSDLEHLHSRFGCASTRCELFHGHRLMLEDRTFRMVRGGSWGSIPRFLRSANRNDSSPSYRYYSLGFRLMLEGAP